VHIIASDRSWIGWSSLQHGHTLLDHQIDFMELAEHLKLENYSVLGI